MFTAVSYDFKGHSTITSHHERVVSLLACVMLYNGREKEVKAIERVTRVLCIKKISKNIMFYKNNSILC